MKKGFTLIELLMVMVIAVALVAVALPKYQRALERSRALEGITNARAVAEYVNSYYLTHSNMYPETIPSDDLVKSRYFSVGNLQPVPGEVSQHHVLVTRDASQGWNYSIKAVIDRGELISLSCQNTGSQDDCAELDLVGNLLN